MPDHVLLLRAINLARRNRLAMADLRSLLIDLGHSDPVTLLASGDAMFRSSRRSRPALAAEIEAGLRERHDLDVTAFVLGPAELAAVVAGNPFPDAVADPALFAVAFLSADLDPELVAGLDPAAYEPDRFAVGSRALYLWYRGGYHGTQISAATWEKFGVRATARNWTTVMKLHGLAQQRAAVRTAERRERNVPFPGLPR